MAAATSPGEKGSKEERERLMIRKRVEKKKQRAGRMKRRDVLQGSQQRREQRRRFKNKEKRKRKREAGKQRERERKRANEPDSKTLSRLAFPRRRDDFRMIILSVAWFFAKGTYYEPISPSEMLEKRPGLHEVKIKGSGSEGCRGLPSSSSFVAVAALGRRSRRYG